MTCEMLGGTSALPCTPPPAVVTATGGMCVVDGVCLKGVPSQFQSSDCQVGGQGRPVLEGRMA